MIKRSLQGIVFTLLVITGSVAQATDLLETYYLALQNDPTFRAAYADLAAQREALRVAYARLLPTADVFATHTLHNKLRADTNLGTTLFRKEQNSYGINASQAIVDLPSWMTVRQARAQLLQAEAQLQQAKQDLMIRTSRAYFALLQAKDNLRFTRAELRANQQELVRAEQRFKVGLDAITAVYDAKARYDAVHSQEIVAANAVVNQGEVLREITGMYQSNLAPLRGAFPLNPPDPNSMDEWVTIALAHNLALQISRYDVSVAKHQVYINQAERAPQLHLTAQYSDGTNPILGTSRTTVEQVNLEASLPIFHGGALFTRVTQAKRLLDGAEARLEAQQRSSVSSTRQLYNLVTSGISTIQADKQAIKSARSSLESTEAAFHVGTRIILDVLDKQRDLYNSDRRLAADQYSFINNTLALKQAAGILNQADLEEVNTWLASSAANTTMQRYANATVSAPFPDAQPLAAIPTKLTKPPVVLAKLTDIQYPTIVVHKKVRKPILKSRHHIANVTLPVTAVVAAPAPAVAEPAVTEAPAEPTTTTTGMPSTYTYKDNNEDVKDELAVGDVLPANAPATTTPTEATTTEQATTTVTEKTPAEPVSVAPVKEVTTAPTEKPTVAPAKHHKAAALSQQESVPQQPVTKAEKPAKKAVITTSIPASAQGFIPVSAPPEATSTPATATPAEKAVETPAVAKPETPATTDVHQTTGDSVTTHTNNAETDNAPIAAADEDGVTDPEAPEPLPASNVLTSSSAATAGVFSGSAVASRPAGATAAATAQPYYVNVSSFVLRRHAISLARNLKHQLRLTARLSRQTVNGQRVTVVRFGPFTTQEAAQQIKARVKKAGFGDATITHP